MDNFFNKYVNKISCIDQETRIRELWNLVYKEDYDETKDNTIIDTYKPTRRSSKTA